MVEAGKFYKLKVIRKSDLGFMLSNGVDEILMHYRQAKKEYNINDEVSAFIYFDKEGRYCATTNPVKASTLKPGLCEVVNVTSQGVFLDINTSKDVLLSTDFLPKRTNLWPCVGDSLYVILKLKRNSLVAKGVDRHTLDRFKEGTLNVNESYDAYVFEVNDGGYLLCTESFNYVFVPKFLTREEYHLGSKVNVKITKVTERDIYGTLVSNKENLISSDRELILDYLKKHNGRMGLTAKSSSESIESLFGISRKAFKRAYGDLYKERIIDFDDNGTFLTK